MSCRLEQQLGPYLEGELPADACRRVEQHLESCADCARVLRELRATVELLRLVPEPLPAPELRHAVMDRVAADPGTRWARTAAWLRNLGAPLPVAVSAVAATALVLVVVGGPDAPPTGVSLGSLVASSVPRPQPSSPAPTTQLAPGTLRPAATGRAARAPLFGARVGGLGAGGAAHDPDQALAPRPNLERCRGFGRSSGEDPEQQHACRPWLAGMLTLAEYDARSFLREVRAVPAPETDAWLTELVGFAVRTGGVGRVVSGLRSSREPGAGVLASRFERGMRTVAAE